MKIRGTAVFVRIDRTVAKIFLSVVPDRKARSAERCGCIQAVANDTLSASDQRLAVSFYGDPHKAQEIRQSDNAAHERFWQSYKDYAEAAAAVCG